MHFIIVLALALAITIAWQAAVLSREDKGRDGNPPAIPGAPLSQVPEGRDDPPRSNMDNRPILVHPKH